MTSLIHSAKKVSAFARFSARSREGFQRSFRVFLLGLVIACGLEVAIDWHATLGEVRGLRDRVRDRGENYVAVLLHSLPPAVEALDVPTIDRLIGGVFDDDEVVFARVTDARGKVVFERIVPTYAAGFAAERGTAFVDYYAHQLERDAKGVVEDPDGQRQRMIHSRHHDIPQSYQDFLVSLHLAKAAPAHHRNEVILFQDRLYTTNKHEHDPAVDYALGRIDGADGKPIGSLVVAFDMGPTNAAIRGKYLKGAGLVVFFIMLILVQNVATRREKLRLLDLEAKYASAKDSIRAALPTNVETSALRIAGAISQSVGSVDGMLWDIEVRDSGAEIVVLDPEGDGVEAAACALHLRAMYRHRREQGLKVPLHEELAALGDAALRIPGKRAVGVLLLRIDGDGSFTGSCCGIAAPRLVAGGTSPVSSAVAETASATDAPAGVVGPVREIAGKLPAGALLLVATDGLGGATKRVDIDSVAAFVARNDRHADLHTLVQDAATWARGTSSEIRQDDIIVLAVEKRAS